MMAWRLTFVLTILFSGLAITFMFSNVLVGSAYVVIAMLSSWMMLYTLKTKNYKPVFWSLAVSGSILSHFTLYFIPEALPYANFLWIIAGIVLIFIGFDKKYGWLFVGFNIAGIVAYTFLGLDDHLAAMHSYSLLDKINLMVEMIFATLIIGYLLNQYLRFQLFSQLQLRKVNVHLTQQNNQNTVLVKEVHHRVKNNLQIIISLLRMQKSEIKSEEAKAHFDDVINRIMTMSMIHQKLYSKKEHTRININEYIKELSQEVISLSGEDIKLEFDFGSLVSHLDLKTIVPFGLLINELILNSCKHAFQDIEEKTIFIQSYTEKDHLMLNYRDSGHWKESNSENASFGFELIEVLTEQLNGTYQRNGSEYRFDLSVDANA